MTALISARDLHKSFGSLPAVNGISLEVNAGEIYGLVGADGAGKTTTIRLLCGALRPDMSKAALTGAIVIAGYDVSHQPDQARENIGYLSQRFSMYSYLTVLENIRFFAEVRGLKPNEWYPRCMEILEFVGLADFKNRSAGLLSGGMKQKLGLASALVTRPRVLLLDEPTTGVDPVTRQDFWQLIIRLAATPLTEHGEGVCVLLSTPYMDEAARCHRIGFMRKGQIIAEGTPGKLRSLLSERILELRGSPLPLLRKIVASDPGIEDVHAFGDHLHIRLVKTEGKDQPRQAQRQALGAAAVIQRLKIAIPAGGGIFTDARSIPAVLEDVFIALSNQEGQPEELLR